MNVLDSINNFQSLSLRDLLEAREQYHRHLLNKKNVVGTAVGLYLIRNSDPWPDQNKPAVDRSPKAKSERNLENSSTRPYSWPCVLVLVDEWVEEGKFGVGFSANDMVPKTLYLPDGRMVPVCVAKVSPVIARSAAPNSVNWPDTRLGGGFPLIAKTQGQELSGSVGCLVTDGHTTYALTSRHVVGKAGDPVYSRLRGRLTQIGVASDLTLSRSAFNDVFPYLPESRSYSTVDVGLVEIDDVRNWTSRTFGLEALSALADVNEMNLGTQLIDQPVCAYGATSGRLDGTIKALFYRYRSVSGYDYVGDLLIAPKDGKTQTAPGDSGTIWHLVLPGSDTSKAPTLHPLAVEWGGQGLGFADGTRNFALATILSNVLHAFDVQLVTQHNTGVRPFWGPTGHYGIAHYAIGLATSPKLVELLNVNADRISFSRSELEDGNVNKRLSSDHFVPLADVPDVIWKQAVSRGIGGRDAGAQKPEHPTHYADVDQRGTNSAQSLLDLCLSNHANVDVKVWQAFYDALGRTNQASRGMLPFRVWQFFDAMQGFAKKKDTASFVAAAGILAHYVGDAAQPLHGSVFADGYKDQSETLSTRTGGTKVVWPGKGVHSAYESKMLDDNTIALFDEIENQTNATFAIPSIASGHDAAVVIIQLMAEAQKLLPPSDLCEKYIELGSGSSKATIDGLWTAFGKKTAATMYNGAAVLAAIWDAAWVAGSGEDIAGNALLAVAEKDLQRLYQDADFLPSLDLDHIGAVLR